MANRSRFQEKLYHNLKTVKEVKMCITFLLEKGNKEINFSAFHLKWHMYKKPWRITERLVCSHISVLESSVFKKVFPDINVNVLQLTSVNKTSLN